MLQSVKSEAESIQQIECYTLPIGWRNPMSTIAFCPWLRISAPCSFGPIEAISYQRGTLPGPVGSALQQTLDAVMEPYLAFGTHPIEHATLFKLSGMK